MTQLSDPEQSRCFNYSHWNYFAEQEVWNTSTYI